MMLPSRKKKKKAGLWLDVLQLALIASLLRPPQLLYAGPKPLHWCPQPASTDILAYLVEHPASPSSCQSTPPTVGETAPPRPAPDPPADGAAASAEPSPSEPSPTDLSEEDLELIEILWRQDVDLGVSRPGPSPEPASDPEESRESKSPVPVDLETGEPLLPIPELEDLDLDLGLEDDLPSPLSLCWDGMLDELADSKSGDMYSSAWPPEPSSSAGVLVGAGTSLSGPPKLPTNQTHFNLFDASPLIHHGLYTPEPYPPGGQMDGFFQSEGDLMNLDLNTTDMDPTRKAMEEMGLYVSPTDMGGFPRSSPLSTSADSAVCSLDSENSLPSEDTFKLFNSQHFPPVSPMPPQSFKLEPPFSGLQPDFPFPHPSNYVEPPETPAYPPSAFYHNHTYSLPGPVPHHFSSGKCSPSKDNKDSVRLQEAGIPLSVEEVVNLPMEDYSEKTTNLGLTDHQLNILKDIRRRGKNKVAAQNCRKRKLDQIHVLSDSLQHLLAQEEEAKRARIGLLETRRAFEQAVDKLQRFIVDRVHVHNQLRTATSVTTASGGTHK